MLNTEQLRIVNTLSGQLLVVSCPGSGKTTVMIHRTHALIESGIDPKKICLITFTKEAATQLEARYEKEYGKTSSFFGTIHSLCFRVIKKAFGYRREDILLATEQWDFFRRILYKNVQTDDLEEYIKKMIGEISFIRNREMDPNVYEPEHSDKKTFLLMFKKYEEYKLSMGKIDFDDMLILTRKCFRECPEELLFWRQQFDHIMIDEFQDTNSIQADIFYMMAGQEGNICVVGDDDQSIYRFRSADSSIMLNFNKVFPNAIKIFLSTNYRSEPEIIKYAGNLIKHNCKRFKKEFRVNKTGNGSVKVRVYEDVTNQSAEIVKMIEAYHRSGVPYEEIAVLYRTNVQNQLLIGQLLRKKIPFFTTEPPRDYHNEFMFGDFMAYYRLANGSWQKGDVQRVLNRPSRYLKADIFKNEPFEKSALLNACKRLGEGCSRGMIQIHEFLADVERLRDKKPKEFLHYLLNVMGYRSFVEQFAVFMQKDKDTTMQLLNMLVKEGSSYNTMEEWKAYADFYAESLLKQRKSKRKEGVCLSTLHSAKGLEWDIVFIIDAAEGFCPYTKAESPEDFEEERRLFYVGMTRARKVLNISYSIGTEKKATISRYIAEMRYPEKGIEEIKNPSPSDNVAHPVRKTN